MLHDPDFLAELSWRITGVAATAAVLVLPAWSAALIDYVVEVPGLAVWEALVVVGP